MASTDGKPSTTAAGALPMAASTANSTATIPARATTTAPSSRARPNSGNSRPRILAQVSAIVIVDPNTARPTTTVSIPDSRIPPNQLTSWLPPSAATAAPRARVWRAAA